MSTVRGNLQFIVLDSYQSDQVSRALLKRQADKIHPFFTSIVVFLSSRHKFKLGSVAYKSDTFLVNQ
jgi:hypothetical protein